MKDLLSRISSRWRDDKRIEAAVRAIRRVHVTVSRLPFPRFFEPSIAVLQSGGKKELLHIEAGHVASWISHVALGSRAKMLALEPSIVQALVQERVTTAMVLLRTHQETAALAALTLKTIRESAHNSSIERLRRLMRQTLFGTSLTRPDAQRVHDKLEFSADWTRRVSEAIAAMDWFAAEVAKHDLARHQRAVIYAVLSEFAHPNARGLLGFRMAQEREDLGGWEIEYRRNEQFERPSVHAALGTMLDNMRIGYAAAELLRGSTVHVDGGRLAYDPPSESVAASVWEHIYLRDYPSTWADPTGAWSQE